MSHLYEALVDFANGETTANRVSFLDEENIVRITRKNDKNLGKSLVYLNFDSDDYVKLFVPENDNYNSHLFDIAFHGGNYYSHIFVDSYYMDDDWQEGYGFQNFNQENLDKIKEILVLLRPELAGVDLRNANDKDTVQVAKFLEDQFNREISQIIYDYSDYYDSCLVEGLKEYIKYHLCDKLSHLGIIEKTCARVYMTTVNQLINLWNKSGMDKDDNLSEVLKNIIEQNDLVFDEDLYEDYHNYYDHKNFDDESYNREVGRELDRIIEKIENDDSFNVYKKNGEIFEKISKLKYNFDVWYPFPEQKSFGEDSRYRFQIKSVEDGKIIVATNLPPISSELYYQEMVLDYDNFLNFLYHPELFS